MHIILFGLKTPSFMVWLPSRLPCFLLNTQLFILHLYFILFSWPFALVSYLCISSDNSCSLADGAG